MFTHVSVIYSPVLLANSLTNMGYDFPETVHHGREE